MNQSTSARALRVEAVAPSAEALRLDIAETAEPRPGPGQVVVEVRAAGVNMSDVKAALGAMPHAVWPRVPGRDFAGVVVDGPGALVGKAVWGGGGDLGISRDGTHASHVVIPVSAVREKPACLSFEEAGAVGVPFVTAFEGYREVGGIQPWDTVLVCGANGKVGQAAIQIATMARARVFGVSHKPKPYGGHSSEPVTMFHLGQDGLAETIREHTDGRGVDIVFNTMGSPYFALAGQVLARQGRQVFLSTFDRAVPFDIFAFYRGRQHFAGIDSLALDCSACATIFERLGRKFAEGHLRPFPVLAEAVLPLERADEAYRRVFGGADERIVLRP